ncbi:MAG: histidine phosphatase family protein [Gaiellaceae bacterium]
MSRRRLYLMRHAEVSYFGEDGTPLNPANVSLNQEGVAQASAAAEALADVQLDRVVTSGLPRTLETAQIVAQSHKLESWSELREIQGGRLSEIPADALEREFVHAFRGVIPNETRFLRGESIGELFDRVVPALERLVADDGWHTALAVLHGGVNRAILSYALTGERMFLGHFEQGPACVNVLDLGQGGEWIVRAVNVTAYDLLHTSHRQTTMERYWEQYRAKKT